VLTDTEIRKAKPKEAAYQLTDGNGLFLRVTPAGGKLWRWKYRFDGAQKEMSFGQYPEVPLAEARERHTVARKLRAEGVDPMEQRKAEKVALMVSDTFHTIVGLWMAHWRTGKSARHVDSTRRRLEANVIPLLGARVYRHIHFSICCGFVAVERWELVVMS
jgi:hypothetical protein